MWSQVQRDVVEHIALAGSECGCQGDRVFAIAKNAMMRRRVAVVDSVMSTVLHIVLASGGDEDGNNADIRLDISAETFEKELTELGIKMKAGKAPSKKKENEDVVYLETVASQATSASGNGKKKPAGKKAKSSEENAPQETATTNVQVTVAPDSISQAVEWLVAHPSLRQHCHFIASRSKLASVIGATTERLTEERWAIVNSLCEAGPMGLEKQRLSNHIRKSISSSHMYINLKYLINDTSLVDEVYVVNKKAGTIRQFIFLKAVAAFIEHDKGGGDANDNDADPSDSTVPLVQCVPWMVHRLQATPKKRERYCNFRDGFEQAFLQGDALLDKPSNLILKEFLKTGIACVEVVQLRLAKSKQTMSVVQLKQENKNLALNSSGIAKTEEEEDKKPAATTTTGPTSPKEEEDDEFEDGEVHSDEADSNEDEAVASPKANKKQGVKKEEEDNKHEPSNEQQIEESRKKIQALIKARQVSLQKKRMSRFGSLHPHFGLEDQLIDKVLFSNEGRTGVIISSYTIDTFTNPKRLESLYADIAKIDGVKSTTMNISGTREHHKVFFRETGDDDVPLNGGEYFNASASGGDGAKKTAGGEDESLSLVLGTDGEVRQEVYAQIKMVLETCEPPAITVKDLLTIVGCCRKTFARALQTLTNDLSVGCEHVVYQDADHFDALEGSADQSAAAASGGARLVGRKQFMLVWLLSRGPISTETKKKIIAAEIQQAKKNAAVDPSVVVETGRKSQEELKAKKATGGHRGGRGRGGKGRNITKGRRKRYVDSDDDSEETDEEFEEESTSEEYDEDTTSSDGSSEIGSSSSEEEGRGKRNHRRGAKKKAMSSGAKRRRGTRDASSSDDSATSSDDDDFDDLRQQYRRGTQQHHLPQFDFQDGLFDGPRDESSSEDSDGHMKRRRRLPKVGIKVQLRVRQALAQITAVRNGYAIEVPQRCHRLHITLFQIAMSINRTENLSLSEIFPLVSLSSACVCFGITKELPQAVCWDTPLGELPPAAVDLTNLQGKFIGLIAELEKFGAITVDRSPTGGMNNNKESDTAVVEGDSTNKKIPHALKNGPLDAMITLSKEVSLGATKYEFDADDELLIARLESFWSAVLSTTSGSEQSRFSSVQWAKLKRAYEIDPDPGAAKIVGLTQLPGKLLRVCDTAWFFHVAKGKGAGIHTRQQQQKNLGLKRQRIITGAFHRRRHVIADFNNTSRDVLRRKFHQCIFAASISRRLSIKAVEKDMHDLAQLASVHQQNSRFVKLESSMRGAASTYIRELCHTARRIGLTDEAVESVFNPDLLGPAEEPEATEGEESLSKKRAKKETEFLEPVQDEGSMQSFSPHQQTENAAATHTPRIAVLREIIKVILLSDHSNWTQAGERRLLEPFSELEVVSTIRTLIQASVVQFTKKNTKAIDCNDSLRNQVQLTYARELRPEFFGTDIHLEQSTKDMTSKPMDSTLDGKQNGHYLMQLCNAVLSGRQDNLDSIVKILNIETPLGDDETRKRIDSLSEDTSRHLLPLGLAQLGTSGQTGSKRKRGKEEDGSVGFDAAEMVAEEMRRAGLPTMTSATPTTTTEEEPQPETMAARGPFATPTTASTANLLRHYGSSSQLWTAHRQQCQVAPGVYSAKEFATLTKKKHAQSMKEEFTPTSPSEKPTDVQTTSVALLPTEAGVVVIVGEALVEQHAMQVQPAKPRDGDENGAAPTTLAHKPLDILYPPGSSDFVIQKNSSLTRLAGTTVAAVADSSTESLATGGVPVTVFRNVDGTLNVFLWVSAVSTVFDLVLAFPGIDHTDLLSCVVGNLISAAAAEQVVRELARTGWIAEQQVLMAVDSTASPFATSKRPKKEYQRCYFTSTALSSSAASATGIALGSMDPPFGRRSGHPCAGVLRHAIDSSDEASETLGGRLYPSAPGATA